MNDGMTGVTGKSPLRAHTRARSIDTRAHTRRAPEQITRHIRHLEAEYHQPIHQVIAGYYQDGQSQRSIARILRLPLGRLRRYSITAGLEPPARPITLQTRSRIHRAHIRAAMRRARGRRITYHGKTHTITEWSELTGIPANTISKRLARGWTPARALTERT